MTTTDYLIDSALVLLVLLQIRERPLTNRSLIRPLVILGIVFVTYLNGVPSAGNDLVLVFVLAAIGVAIGAGSGLTVLMRPAPDGQVTARTGWLSGFLWVLGMGSRFAFIYWITHTGQSAIASFSLAHSITGADAWTVALLAMAAGEVIARTVILAARRARLRTQAPLPQFA